MDQAVSIYIPMDRRQALVHGDLLPEWAAGAVLFADISGFTPLTEALLQALGPRRGAEELTHQLNRVYDALVDAVHAFGGSVIAFSGDAITCWFGEGEAAAGTTAPAALRAAACALALQQAMAAFTAVPLPAGGSVPLALKVAVAGGEVRRMLVGDPAIQQIEVMAGAPLVRMAAAEQLATSGEVLLDMPTTAHLGAAIQVAAWRNDPVTGDQFALVTQLRQPVAPTPWPALPNAALTATQVRPWMLPAIYERLQEGLGEFLTELRPVVVLFLRFAGLDYDGDPAAGAKLDRYICWAQHVLARYEGALMHLTIGDKGSYFFAAFGAPIAHEDDPRRAVMAALDLRTPPAHLGFTPTVQIGISQGTMRTGTYGGSTSRTYSVLGDEVNLAARLMQHAAPGEVLTSGHVQRAVSAAFVWEVPPPIQVKGKRWPVPIARVVRAQATWSTGIKYAGMLIGRAAEVSQALQALQPILQGQRAGLLYIFGEAGMGKSRLADELRRQPEYQQRLQWLFCPADELLRQSLNPFRAWLRVYFNQDSEGAEAENKTRFTAVLDALIAQLRAVGEQPDPAATGRPVQDQRRTPAPIQPFVHADMPTRVALADEIERTRSFLGALVDLRWDDSLYAQLDPKLRFENTLVALKTLILAESLRRPLVLHLESAHLLDADSGHFLQVLTRATDSYPFAVVLTSRYRDDGSRVMLPVDTDVPQQVVDLRGLDADGVRTLAAQILGGRIDADLARFLVARTNGNPFFVEQLALDLRERGLLTTYTAPQPDGTGSQLYVSFVAEEQAPALPDSINAVLVTRLDRLATQVRVVVQTAAILGQEFEVQVLALMLRHDPDLPRKLQQAEAAAVWQPLSELRYLFSHALLRDAAYAVQLETRLRELHALAGTALEQLYAADPAPHAADLTYHYQRAADPIREWRYARMAGEYAATRFANADAVRYFSRALELTPPEDHAGRYALLWAREQVHDRQGDRDAQRQALAALRELADSLADPQRQIEVALRQAHYADVTSDYQSMTQAAQSAIDLAQATGNRRGEAAGYLHTARAHWYQGDYAAATAQATQALELAHTAGEQQLEADCLRMLGNTALYRSDYPAARVFYEQALAQHHDLGDQQGASSTMNNLGIVAFYQGDYLTAHHYYEQTLRLKRIAGDRYGESLALLNLGEVAAVQGDYTGAHRYYEQTLRLKRDSDDRYGESLVLFNLGEVALIQGDYTGAQQDYEQALRLCRAIGHRQQESWTLAKLGLLFHHLNDDATARDYSRQALQMAQELNDRNLQALALTHLGHALVALEQLADATAAYRQALELRQALEQPNQALEPLAGLARVALIQGDQAQASRYATDLLHHLERGSVDGTDEPFRIYLTCYEVLQAQNDPQAAALLEQAYQLLREQAERLDDAAAQQAFLEQVPTHRALVAAWQQVQQQNE